MPATRKSKGARDPPWGGPDVTGTSRGLMSGGWSTTDVSGRTPPGVHLLTPGREGGETGGGAVPTAAGIVSPHGKSAPTWVGGSLSRRQTPVKGTRILERASEDSR